MKKVLLFLLLVFSIISISSCKDNSCNHVDEDSNCICDLCKVELEHEYVKGECIKCHKSQYSEDEIMTGKYILSSASYDGSNVTKDFAIYQAEFFKDLTMIVKIYKGGFLETRESTYTKSGSIITETHSSGTYIYTVFSDQLLTTYDDLGDEIEVYLIKEASQDVLSEVDFNSVLFGEDISLTKIYNYCPAIIYDVEDGKEVMHVWYCTNRDSGVIVDYIGYRKGVKQDNGKWSFSDQQIVLSPTQDTWDGYHTCDPSVIKGEFNYKGTKYSYLMAYLGCVTTDYQKNETGLAVSNSPAGPWVKLDEINPIVPWYDDGDITKEEAKYQSYFGTSNIYWGTGMPSLISVDNKSEIILFYQSTLRGTGIRRIDLSDIEHPVVKYTVSLNSKGATNSQGLTGRIGIPDFAYDSATKRFYVASVTNEKNPADVTLTRVNSHSFVGYVENVNSIEELSTLLESGNYTWKVLGFVGPSETGWERNHNPGLVKTMYGGIPDPNNISLIVSTGHNSWANENIFTYRLFGWNFKVNK